MINFINEANPDTEITKNVTKVGFLYNGEIDDHGWGQSHYEGISASAKELNLEIIYAENVPFDENCVVTMENMISQGCEIIICNSYNYGEWILQVAEQVICPVMNPETKILSVSVRDGVCYVNLDDSFLNQVYDVSPEVTIYAITNALVELPNVNKVQISVGGETNINYRESMNLSTVYERNLDLVNK